MSASLQLDPRREYLLEWEREIDIANDRARKDRNSQKTVYGFYKPNGSYGGELVRCWQEQNGVYVETDATPTVTLPIKLEPLVLKDKRFKIAFGGRGAAKSQGVGSILCAKAKDYQEKTLCIREIQNSIEDSVHSLLKGQIESLGFDGFTATDKTIRYDGSDVFRYRGLRHNTDAVKSAHGFRRAWAEEAQSLSDRSITDLTPSIREAGSELWFTLNPKSSADPIAQRFLQPFYKQLLADGYYEDELHLVIWINYTDNPWHGELESERAFDEENLSAAAYRHKWHGHYNDEVEDSIIPVEWFDAAIDAHIKLGFKGEGAKVASYDPSDLGPDEKGYALRHGSVVLEVDERAIGDVNEGTDWALDKAINASADHFVWDCDGMGVSLKRQIDNALKGKPIRYVMFKGSMAPEHPDRQFANIQAAEGQEQRKTNKESLYNRRAQYYIRLRDRFYSTYRATVKGEYINPDEMISLSSSITDMDGLRAEVCRVPSKPNGNGKIRIMTKLEMAALKIASPNRADALMMSMIEPNEAAIEDKPIHIPDRPRI